MKPERGYSTIVIVITFLADPSRKQYLLNGLQEEWIIERKDSHEQRCTVLDTYDYTLLRQKKIALLCNGNYSFFDLLDASKDVSRSVTSSVLENDKQPKEIVKNRGGWKVNRRTQADVNEEFFLVRNTDRKGVARLFLLLINIDTPPLHIMRLQISPLRGYDEEAVNLSTLFERILTGDKMRFPWDRKREIRPRMTDTAGIRIFCSDVLSRVRSFERGIVRDTDPECLHQYRVNVRKIRALLGLSKSIFPRDWLQALTDELSSIMKRTNRLRDLDVHIDAMEGYRQLLPDALKAGAVLLEELLKHERQKEQGKVAAFLASEKYLGRMRQLEKNLDKPPENEENDDTGKPLQATVLHILERRFNKMVKKITEVEAEAEDLSFHQIRIEGKKLRYALEFLEVFSDLKQVKKIIKKMKRFQDLFGEYNDLCVQEEFLHIHMDGIENDDNLKAKRRDIEMAVGGILTIISKKKAEVRELMLKETVSVRDKNLKKNISKMVKEGMDEISRSV